MRTQVFKGELANLNVNGVGCAALLLQQDEGTVAIGIKRVMCSIVKVSSTLPCNRVRRLLMTIFAAEFTRSGNDEDI